VKPFKLFILPGKRGECPGSSRDLLSEEVVAVGWLIYFVLTRSSEIAAFVLGVGALGAKSNVS
jgi:hypothetical protein